MNFKYCIAKMVDTAPVYQTDTVNTWVYDITDSTVEWYASEGSARSALRGPETFVVPYEEFTMATRCEALTRACEAISEAIRVGAVSGYGMTSLLTEREVFEAAGIQLEREDKRGPMGIWYGTLHGVTVYCGAREVSE